MRSYDVAARFASVFITGMVLYTGYLIPIHSMKRWLFWIYCTYRLYHRWIIANLGLDINPLGYGFSAILINEVCIEIDPQIRGCTTDLVPLF
jgi:ATP-binding cassette subfamily G (WHITE) protein 2 (SNQ2)